MIVPGVMAVKAFDAYCHACGRVTIEWVPWMHEEGDKIKMAHCQKTGACGSYARMTLRRRLDGLSHVDKWGPED